MEQIEALTYKARQRQRQGRTEDAIGLFEQALALRIDLHGPESSSVRRACESLSDVLNGASLKHLQNEEYEVAKRLLEKAEILTGPEDLITAVTYNNIACYYRRKKKLRTALKYLERAQRIEMKSRHVANPAGTRLNLCAVLSQLERHSEALEHAQAAVVLLQEELSMMSTIDDFGDKNPEALNKMAVLAISYHNIGVEEEYLKRHGASLAAYRRGVKIAKEYLGPDNDITRTLIKSCHAAQEHLDNEKPKQADKIGASPTSIIRHGDSSGMGGAYDALHEFKRSKRRAQSAGLQRSKTSTPQWAIQDDALQSTQTRPTTAFPGRWTRARDEDRTRAWVDAENSKMPHLSGKGPIRSNVRDRPTRIAQDRNTFVDGLPGGGHSSRRIKDRRPISAMAAHTKMGDSGLSFSIHGQELEDLHGGVTSTKKKGPRTPRTDEIGDKIPAIRRPPSASLREPVRPNFGNGFSDIVKEPLASQLRRVDQDHIRGNRELKAERPEGKPYHWEDTQDPELDGDEDCSDDQFQSNHRITYERPGLLPKALSHVRKLGGGVMGGESLSRLSSAASLSRDRADDGMKREQGTHWDLLDDDVLDEDVQCCEDVDSGTEEFMSSTRNQTGSSIGRNPGRERRAMRPSSASFPKPEGIAIMPSGRPASASMAVIKAKDRIDALPARTGSDSGLQRASSAKGLRPPPSNVPRPNTANPLGPVPSCRPGTAVSLSRPATAKQERRNDVLSTASDDQREERELLDTLSDHSEYESDLNITAGQETRPGRSYHGLEAKRSELLGKAEEMGLDHSNYESDDGDLAAAEFADIIKTDDADRNAEGQVDTVGGQGLSERPLASAGRPQRPSDSKTRRPSDFRRSPPAQIHPGGSGGEMFGERADYESNDDGTRVPDGAMASTLKWLEASIPNAP